MTGAVFWCPGVLNPLKLQLTGYCVHNIWQALLELPEQHQLTQHLKIMHPKLSATNQNLLLVVMQSLNKLVLVLFCLS